MLLIYALASIVFINCAYFLLFSKFSFLKHKIHENKEQYPISLIICAKNEAENLRKNIPKYLDQDYLHFELILINDSSNDETLDVMEKFEENDSRIQIVNVENNEAFWGNKKYALTLGIKKAKNKRMLFTDADCYPASTSWISEMASKLSSEKQLVLGYGAYEKKHGLLNTLIRFETVMTAIQYFSYAVAKNPYMGVGRNLAYTSPLYYSTNGFMSHIKVPSGDDDLFVNEAATKDNTALCYSETAFTFSKPKTTWSTWILQKRRHITTASLYKSKHKTLLGLYFLANLLFWVLAGVSYIFAPWEFVTGIIAFRFLIQYIVIGSGVKKLHEKGLLLFLPVLELFLLLVQLSIFISNSRSKPKHWN